MSARIPRKKGQPANSKKHSDLYTDENPKGTIHGLKFATVDDAKASVAKIKNSGRSHAHKIQAAIAMEQRARVMGKKGPAAVYRKFINAMKKKTKEMQKEDTGVLSPRQAKERIKRLDNIRKQRTADAKERQAANDKEKNMTQKTERLVPDKKLKNLKVSDVDSKKNVGDTRSRAMSRRAKKRGTVLSDGLWDNIRKKRERIKRGSGERMRKPGEKGAPTADALARAKNEMAITGVGSIPNPADTAMGPSGKGLAQYMHDRRKRRDGQYALVKRFKKYLEDRGVV